MNLTPSYILSQFDSFGSIFAANYEELMFVLPVLHLHQKFNNVTKVVHELGGYTVYGRKMEDKLKEPEYYYNLLTHDLMLIWWEKNRPVGKEWVEISEKDFYNRDFIYGVNKEEK